MYTTYLNFEHLRQAEEQQLLRELEYRRVARERGDRVESATARVMHRITRRIHRPTHATSSVLSPSR